jgi:hypothetical protein
MFFLSVVGVHGVLSPPGMDVCLPAQVHQNKSKQEAQKEKCKVTKGEERRKNVKNKMLEEGEAAKYVSASIVCDRTIGVDVEGCNYEITLLGEC